MNEQEQAQRLATWLDQGGPPPEGVDEDVLEAIYALHPDRAPAPAVSADDILADVRTGPLAAPATSAATAATPSVPPPANNAGWSRWLRGGVAGAVAAAAAALILVQNGAVSELSAPSYEAASVPAANQAQDVAPGAEAEPEAAQKAKKAQEESRIITTTDAPQGLGTRGSGKGGGGLGSGATPTTDAGYANADRPARTVIGGSLSGKDADSTARAKEAPPAPARQAVPAPMPPAGASAVAEVPPPAPTFEEDGDADDGVAFDLAADEAPEEELADGFMDDAPYDAEAEPTLEGDGLLLEGRYDASQNEVGEAEEIQFDVPPIASGVAQQATVQESVAVTSARKRSGSARAERKEEKASAASYAGADAASAPPQAEPAPSPSLDLARTLAAQGDLRTAATTALAFVTAEPRHKDAATAAEEGADWATRAGDQALTIALLDAGLALPKLTPAQRTRLQALRDAL